MTWLEHSLDPLLTACKPECLHFWEVVGVWFTGAATTAVVVVSLVLAIRQNKPALKVSATKRVFISGVPTGTPSVKVADFPDVIAVEAINVGMIPVKVIAVWWTVYIPRPLRWLGLRHRGALFQNAPDASHRSHDIPANLAHSDTLQWVLDLDHIATEIASKLLSPSLLWQFKLRQLRICVRTAVEITIWGRLDSELLADLRERTRRLRVGKRAPPS